MELAKHRQHRHRYKEEKSWKEDRPVAAADNAAAGRTGAKRATATARHHGRRFSYAAGCLGSHYLAGEERFSVEHDAADDSVWYEVYTFSRPAHPLAALGYPVVRALQAAFRRESARAVARAAAGGVVERSMDARTRRRLEAAEGGGGGGGGGHGRGGRSD